MNLQHQASDEGESPITWENSATLSFLSLEASGVPAVVHVVDLFVKRYFSAQTPPIQQ